MVIPRQKGKKLKYFFYNDELHKALHIHRGEDTIDAWNYPQNKRRTYVYSDVRRRGGRAWTTQEVAKLINRTQIRLEQLILAGEIPEPPSTYSLTTGRKYKYLWSEKDIMDLHRYLCTIHYGRPRKDGRVTPLRLPSAAELRAMLRQDKILYVKTDEGFVPTWQAENF